MKSHGNLGTLHANKLDAFVAFCEGRGFTCMNVGNHTYEVARLRHPDREHPMLIYKRERTDHLTVVNCFDLVEEFMKE